jgi:hypothetical protein
VAIVVGGGHLFLLVFLRRHLSVHDSFDVHAALAQGAAKPALIAAQVQEQGLVVDPLHHAHVSVAAPAAAAPAKDPLPGSARTPGTRLAVRQ